MIEGSAHARAHLALDARVDVSGSGDRRRALLDATATDVGRRLFATCRDELSGAGRPIAGGWPGTIREARALAATVLASVFAQRRLTSPTQDEVGSVMRGAYEEARRAWRASSVEKRTRRA